MSTFIKIVEQGSLTGAANQLGQSVATMVRTLSDLENYLGVRLLNRTTRRIALTEEGREYLIHCRHILDEIDSVEHGLDRRNIEPVGKLKISAPLMFGQQHIQPLLTQWLSQNTALSAELSLHDHVVDLLEESVDIALRIGTLADSSLIAKPLGYIQYQCCASPSLIAERGLPKKPQDLQDWPAITYSHFDKQWLFSKQLKTYNVTPVVKLSCNQTPAILAAAAQGLGMVYVMNYQAAHYIARNELVQLLPEYQTISLPVHFVYPHRRLLTPRVRYFFEWATPQVKTLLNDLN